MKNNLFNMAKLREICELEPTPEQMEIVKEWCGMVERNELVKEVENYINFTFKILNKLFDYSESDIAFEHTHGEGRVEFSIRDPQKKDKFRLIIELKGQNTELDKLQKRKTKFNRSPVDQAFFYAIGSRGVQWIVVSNYNETRIYNYYKKRRFISFTAKDLLDRENLKIFLNLLSKETFLNKMIPDKALKETILIDQQFSNAFYQLYHATRLEIINQLIKNGEEDIKFIIQYAQMLLNRILFIAYAEDSGLCPSEILTKTILGPIKSMDVSLERTEIWHKINLLFNDFNGGKKDKGIPGYNGGLFKEDLEKIKRKDEKKGFYFYDLIEESYKANSLAFTHKFKYDKINEILGNYKQKLNPIFKNFLVFANLDYKQQITVEIFGHVFEQSIIDLEKLKKEGVASLISKNKTKTKGKRKKEGIYYTPEIVTYEITRNAIIKFLSEQENVFNVENLILEYLEKIEVLEQKVKNIKILDIASGSGAFLSQAVDILIDIYEKIYDLKIQKGLYDKDPLKRFSDIYGLKVEIVTKNIFGADISDDAIKIAHVSLFLKLANKEYQLPDLKLRFFHGNSIISSKEIVDNPIEWDQITQMPFDVIVTNPPYIPTEDLDEKEKGYFTSNYSVYRKYDTSVIFIEKALDLLNDGGVLGVILPLTWQTGENYESFRKSLFSKAKLIKLINLPFDIFPEAYVDTGIAIFEKNPINERDFYLTYQFEKNFKLATLHVEDWERISLKEVQSHDQMCVYTSNFCYTLWNKINQLILREDFVSLGEITESTQGYHAGKYVRKKAKTLDSDFLFYEKGRANRYYVIIDKKSYVDMSEWSNIKKYYEPPKIFIRRIINRQDRLMAFYVEDSLLTSKDYNPFILKEDNDWNKRIDYGYLTAILNSKLISFLYIGFSAIALKDDFRQTVLKKLRNLPIPTVNKEKQGLIKEIQQKLCSKWKEFEKSRELIGNTLVSKYKDKVQNGTTKLFKIHKWKDEYINKIFKNLKLEEVEQVIKYINTKKPVIIDIINQIKALEKRIDEEVYSLFNMSEKEIDLVENRFLSKI